MVGGVQRRLIHPRKMVNAMREFLTQANDITYEAYYDTAETEKLYQQYQNKEISEWDWVTAYVDSLKTVETPCSIRVSKETTDGYCAYLYEFHNNEEIIHIGYDISEYLDNKKYLMQFEVDFRNRCPMARGFANITLSLLHELGHFYVDLDDGIQWTEEQRKRELERIRTLPRILRNLEYFKMPDENGATEWAIAWLNDPEHRKIAKAFEKKFFSCFEKPLDKSLQM